tara:strand:+ start:202 stop:750 length:549 start_codon:yes stop_codon:yes gene_type:complete
MHQLLYPATLGSFFVLFGIGILNTERNFLGNINFLFSVIFLLYFILSFMLNAYRFSINRYIPRTFFIDVIEIIAMFICFYQLNIFDGFNSDYSLKYFFLAAFFIPISQAINNIKNKRDSFKYNVLNYISAIIYLVGFLINMFFSEEKFGKYFNYGIATINLILVVIFSYLLIIEQNIIGRNK